MEGKNLPPPDGGWGWMVVLGAALINMVNQAMFANFGLIFGEHLKALAGGHATGITLVMALSVVVTNFSGLLVGPMMKRVSIRTVNFIGIFLVGSGMIVSSFAKEIWHICIGYGVMTGLGLGLLASGTFLAINDFFTTRKSTAVGMSMAGTAVGQMVMPTFIGMLLKKYEYSGTTFVLGFLSYTGIIGAMFFKPIWCCKTCCVSDTEKDSVENGANEDKEKNGINMDLNSNQGKNNDIIPKKEEEATLLHSKKISIKRVSSGIIRQSIEEHYKDSTVEIANSQQIKLPKEETMVAKVAHSLGLHLLKDLTYVHMLIGLGLGYMSSVTFSTFFPMFLQDEVEFSMWETTSCMTALSFSDVMGRITVSELCRRLKLGNRSSFMVGAVFLAICRSWMVELTGFTYVFAISFFVGYFRSITVINQNLVISEYIDKDQLPSAVGLNMVTKALLTLTIGQTLGLLKDQFSYGMCIHILDAILFIVVGSWTIELLVKRIKRKP